MNRTLLLGLGAAFLTVGACGKSSTPSASGTPGNDGSTGQDSSVPPPPSKVNVTNETIQSGGDTRSYVLAVPKTYDAAAERAYPLVLVLHGDGGDGPSTRAGYTFDNETGDDAIVAYPSGKNREWYQSLDVNSYDMRFLHDLVDALEERYPIDSNRVFGAGYSSGGFMVNFVACMIPMFRAIAANGAGMAYDPNNQSENAPPPDCTAGPIAALIMHDPADGTGDPVWNAQYWAKQSPCANPYNPPPNPVDPSPCKAYNGCDPNYPVTLCIVPGMGHWWWAPGMQATWAFFQALP